MSSTKTIFRVALWAALSAAPAWAADNPCNPCGGHKAANPCGPKQAANPCNPCAGKAAPIAVNPCHAKRGTVFYVSDPMRRDTVTFNSRAPLEDIVGTSNTVSGYIVFDPRYPTMGLRGSLSVPVASLDTGIPLRDEHLRSEMWLGAKRHPHITFTIQDTKDVFLVKESPAFQTYNTILMGEFRLHGKTNQVKIPARVTYLKQSAKTKQKMPGDLLAIRANFDVPLRDFGITGPAGMDLVGNKVGDVIAIEVSLFASSKMPGKGGNPCNPCGGKK